MSTISITANLTADQEILVAKTKGWTETVGIPSIGEDGSITLIETPNKPASQFIQEVYYNMIINDVSKIFIEDFYKKNEQERITQENTIKEIILQSITSSIDE